MPAKFNRVLGLLGVTFLLALGCSSSKKIQTGTPCVLNSDCKNPLSCTYGTCHEGCRSTVDCTTPGTECTKVDGFGVCLLPTESTCTSENPTCPKGLTCAVDLRCRSVCTSAMTDCMGSQICVSGVCADPTDLVGGDLPHKRTGMDGGANGPGDGGGKDSSGSTSIDAAIDAPASDGPGSTGADGAKIEPGKVDAPATADATTGPTPCPSAQTQFGFIAQGDSNPYFTSGVGVRTANSLLIFSAYAGPAPSGFDGGAGYTTPGSDGGVSTVNLIYVQAFDTVKSKAKGPATVLFQAASGSQFTVDDVSIAPTGEIALLHSQGPVGGTGFQNALYASFMSPTSDTAGPGVQLEVTVQIESSVMWINNANGNANFPRAIWSPVLRAFVFSWLHGNQTSFGYGEGTIKVRRFLPSGQGAGGDTNNVITPGYGASHDQAAVGVSGDLLGVGSASGDCNGGCSKALLTILNAKGQVGETVDLKSPFSNIYWITVAGTDTGFVGLFGGGDSVATSFVPKVTLGDAGAPVGSDGGVDKVIPGFTFNSAATRARAISDNTGGVGGIGVALLEPSGVSFLYVNPDGKTYVGPGTAISGSGGFMAAVSNFGGSFGVSLYNSTTHATQMVASGCVK